MATPMEVDVDNTIIYNDVMTKFSQYGNKVFQTILEHKNKNLSSETILELNNLLDDTIGFAFEHKQSLSYLQLNDFRDGIRVVLCICRDKNYGFGNEILFYNQFYQLIKFTYTYRFFTVKYIHDLLWKIVNVERITYTRDKIYHHSIGSWKDIKRLSLFIKKKLISIAHPIFELLAGMFAQQIKQDYENLRREQYYGISLVAKWAPREKQKNYRFFFRMIINILYPYYGSDMNNTYKYKKYRIILSDLNRYLEIPEISLCAREWATINFQYTSHSFDKKHFNAIYNCRNANECEFDKRACYDNYEFHRNDTLTDVDARLLFLNEKNTFRNMIQQYVSNGGNKDVAFNAYRILDYEIKNVRIYNYLKF